MLNILGKALALLIVAAHVTVACLLPNEAASRTSVAVATAMFSVPGLVIIFFREQLAQTGTIRGVLTPTSPVLLGGIGWVVLLVLPAVFLLGTSGALLSR